MSQCVIQGEMASSDLPLHEPAHRSFVY